MEERLHYILSVDVEDYFQVEAFTAEVPRAEWDRRPSRVVANTDYQIEVTPAATVEKTMEYIAYLHKDRKSDFGVSFPDFPGCVTAGKTLDEARRMAGEALALHIRGMVEDGETVPDPSTIDDVAEDPAMKGASTGWPVRRE